MGATFNIPTKNTETRRYVKRVKNAGKILEGSSVIDIDDFVTGCKDLGVWNSMVCWPLRSTQNTGTNTALSLGGLGTYDGTLVNGPTWGLNGVTCGQNWDNGNSIDILGLTKAWTPVTLGVVAYSGVGSFGSKNTNSSPASDIGTMCVLTNTNNLGDNTVTMNIAKQMEHSFSSYTSPSFCALSAPFIGATLYRDGNISQTHPSTETISEEPLNHYNQPRFMSIGGNSTLGSFGTAATGVIPFAFICKQSLSQNEWNTYRNLYKTTLGKGLGLP
jgi:hypothetical protein